jgi:DNA-binding MarR family transcriptional regulator
VTDALPDLDEVFHARARLGIMTLLAASGSTDFTSLKSQLGLTDGNLGAHVRVLEDHGYVGVTKSFNGRKPRTTLKLTPHGRRAFRDYLAKLEAVIKMASAE